MRRAGLLASVATALAVAWVLIVGLDVPANRPFVAYEEKGALHVGILGQWPCGDGYIITALSETLCNPDRFSQERVEALWPALAWAVIWRWAGYVAKVAACLGAALVAAVCCQALFLMAERLARFVARG